MNIPRLLFLALAFPLLQGCVIEPVPSVVYPVYGVPPPTVYVPPPRVVYTPPPPRRCWYQQVWVPSQQRYVSVQRCY